MREIRQVDSLSPQSASLEASSLGSAGTTGSVSLEWPASAIHLELDLPMANEKRVIIRPLRLMDVPPVVEAIGESLSELRKFMPWSYFPQTIESQRKRIVELIHSYWTGKEYSFGIFSGSTGSFLGCIGLHHRTLNSRGLEIRYWIRSSACGQGLATTVTRSLIVYGFHYLGLSRVQCGYNSNNLASARINDKCNFKIEGTLKNFEMPATEAMRQNGWIGSEEFVMRGLCPEDIHTLDWYAETLKSLTVMDWLGNAVAPPVIPV
jgi:RimJ/RimL family protein N-acetyltransferase